jgi:hypothetical protein
MKKHYFFFSCHKEKSQKEGTNKPPVAHAGNDIAITLPVIADRKMNK